MQKTLENNRLRTGGGLRCLVPGCPIRFINKPEGVTFHRFPGKNREKWLTAIKMPLSFEVSAHHAVCSEHFNQDDFWHGGRRLVKDYVVPSKNLPVKPPETTNLPVKPQENTKNLPVKPQENTNNLPAKPQENESSWMPVFLPECWCGLQPSILLDAPPSCNREESSSVVADKNVFQEEVPLPVFSQSDEGKSEEPLCQKKMCFTSTEMTSSLGSFASQESTNSSLNELSWKQVLLDHSYSCAQVENLQSSKAKGSDLRTNERDQQKHPRLQIGGGEILSIGNIAAKLTAKLRRNSPICSSKVTEVPLSRNKRFAKVRNKAAKEQPCRKKTPIENNIFDIDVVEEAPSLNVPPSSSTGESFDVPVEEQVVKQEPTDNGFDDNSAVVDATSMEVKYPLVQNEEMEEELYRKPAATDVKSVEAENTNSALKIQLNTKSWTTDAAAAENESKSCQNSILRNMLTNPSVSASKKMWDDDELDGKTTIGDFSAEDMKNPDYALKFYDLVTSLVYDNLTWSKNIQLCARNRRLEEEVECLLKKIEEGDVDACVQCKQVPVAPKIDNASNGGLKRKAASECVPEASGTEPATTTNSELAVKTPQTEQDMWQRPKILRDDGPFRIVHLEPFITAIIEMQRIHFSTCTGKMTIFAETLHGIVGEWSFVCSECGDKRTIATIDSPLRFRRADQRSWLEWLECLPEEHLNCVRTAFEKLNVPFYFTVVSDGLVKAVTCYRSIMKQPNVFRRPLILKRRRKV